jgi:hypothetical protein
MQVTIKAHVHAKQFERYDAKAEKFVEEIGYELYPFDMSQTSSRGLVFIGVQDITVDVPAAFDIRDGLVKNLEAEKKKLMAEFNVRVAAIDNQIRKYLAIENNPTEVV